MMTKIYTMKELRVMPDKEFEVLCATRIMGWYSKRVDFKYEGIADQHEDWWIQPQLKSDDHTGYTCDVGNFKPFSRYRDYQEMLSRFYNDWNDGLHCASQYLCALLEVDGHDSIDVAGRVMLSDLKTQAMAVILGHQSWYLED